MIKSKKTKSQKINQNFRAAISIIMVLILVSIYFFDVEKSRKFGYELFNEEILIKKFEEYNKQLMRIWERGQLGVDVVKSGFYNYTSDTGAALGAPSASWAPLKLSEK